MAVSLNGKNPADWREKELSLEEVIKKHPNVSPFVILKTDLLRRGAVLSDAAKKTLNPERDAVYAREIYNDNQAERPNGLTLRDGTTIVGNIAITDIWPGFNGGIEPYTIDVADGKLVVTDKGKVIEDVYFWPKPDYYDKVTTSGKPMWQILNSRPQRMDINIYQYCDFWKEPGAGCKFCSIAATYKNTKGGKNEHVDFEEIAEAVETAVSQPGRFRMIMFCSGSILSGAELLDDEVDQYVKLFKRLEKIFHSKKIMTQLVATAYNERQLRRLHDETFLSGYTSDIEILNEEIFNWVCPGKAKYIGYKGWRDRLFKAVEIFGPNSVNTTVVSGAELVEPNGYKNEEEALEAYLTEAEYFMQHGVGFAQTVFRPSFGSFFKDKKSASLDYVVSFAEGLDAL